MLIISQFKEIYKTKHVVYIWHSNIIQMDDHTVLVAVGAASNACGTISPVKEIAK